MESPLLEGRKERLNWFLLPCSRHWSNVGTNPNATKLDATKPTKATAMNVFAVHLRGVLVHPLT